MPNLNLDYYYGNEAEQYSFYRIPKVLLTDERYKCVSMDAKVLYGLMLDRMGLSVRSGWMDSEGRVYIYFTMEEAMGVLNCGKDKAVKLFKELDTPCGVGLIERHKQGLGKPARIYVKNFTLPPDLDERSPDPLPDPMTSEKPKSALPSQPQSVDLASEISNSVPPKNGSQHSEKTDTNKTDKNKTDMSDTELSPYPPPAPRHRSRSVGWAGMEQMDSYRTLLRANICYGELLRERPYDADLIDGYVELIPSPLSFSWIQMAERQNLSGHRHCHVGSLCAQMLQDAWSEKRGEALQIQGTRKSVQDISEPAHGRDAD